MEDSDTTEVKTDEALSADVVAILESGEAGLGDVMAAYESVEAHYMAAVAVASPPASESMYVSNTAG